MSTWEDGGLQGRKEYSSEISEGFVSTRQRFSSSGVFGNSFKYDGEPASVSIPMIHFLKVHEEFPYIHKNLGNCSLRPKRDTRLDGQIARDPNPKIHDVASFLLFPGEIEIGDSERDVEIIANFPATFERGDTGRLEPTTLLYFPKWDAPIDGSDTRMTSIVPEVDVSNHLFDWALHMGRVRWYDSKARFGEGWKNYGVVNFEGMRALSGAVWSSVMKLEERFETRLLVEESFFDKH